MLLEVNGVDAGYGKIQILDRMTLKAQKNKLTLLIGPNGAEWVHGLLKRTQ
jgi:ABC-type branched-subunit amino acid transport system ATPase component